MDEPTVDAGGLRTGHRNRRSASCECSGPLQADHRGSLLELIDTRDAFWADPIVYAYRFTVRPGRIKGWGMHRIQSDRYVTVSGRVRVVLFDGRAGSSTYQRFAEFQFTDETPGAVLIPPGVWHADQNIGDSRRGDRRTSRPTPMTRTGRTSPGST